MNALLRCARLGKYETNGKKVVKDHHGVNVEIRRKKNGFYHQVDHNRCNVSAHFQESYHLKTVKVEFVYKPEIYK